MNAGAIGGSGSKVTAVHTVALYRPSDGRVLHVHQSVVLENARMLKKEDVERRAIEAARRMGHEVKGLATLHLDQSAPVGRLQVDLTSMKLVPVKSPIGLPRARRAQALHRRAP